MVPWSLLDTAQIPGGAELRLMRRGSEFSIMLGQNELMNSRVSGSEQMLAKIVCELIKARERPALLIGGLGMGFTLRAALDGLGREAVVVVAELVPGVVAWARGPLRDIFGDSLTDPRVSIHHGDVADLIRPARSRFDAIVLDVDNGPQGLVRKANDTLYSTQGLDAAHTALRPGGVLAVWSTVADAGFTRRLRKIGFDVDERIVRASRKGGGARHVIWIATRVIKRM
jgi:spermidine synthase